MRADDTLLVASNHLARWRAVAMTLIAVGVSAFGCTTPRSQDPGDGGADHPSASGDGGGKDGADAAPDTARDVAPDTGRDVAGDAPVESGLHAERDPVHRPAAADVRQHQALAGHGQRLRGRLQRRPVHGRLHEGRDPLQ